MSQIVLGFTISCCPCLTEKRQILVLIRPGRGSIQHYSTREASTPKRSSRLPVINGETANTCFIVFNSIRSWINPTIFNTRGEHPKTIESSVQYQYIDKIFDFLHLDKILMFKTTCFRRTETTLIVISFIEQ